jgi:predicted metalloprotease with PDZ domain
MRRLPTLCLPALALAACWGGSDPPPPRPDPLPEPRSAADGAVASYTLSFPAPQTQYLSVEAVYPDVGDTLDVSMVAWTPGSYKIRDYARHLEGLTAATPDGTRLPARKLDKDTWRIQADGAETVVVRYDLYARTLSVRGNWVEPDFAMLNGAPTYLLREDREGPLDVRLERPDAWPEHATALPPHPGGEAHRFRATDVDQLLDSPIVLGDLEIWSFSVEDPSEPGRTVPHRLVHAGDTGPWDGEGTAADVAALTREQVRFWGGIPYRSYSYLNVIAEAGGGLEHQASTLMLTRRHASRTRAQRLRWLGLVSHEFFHTWNVKRLRPVELGPFAYDREVYTRSLWIAEGLTSYYDDLLLVRAGLMTEEEYLDKLESNIRGVRGKPGRFVRSLEDASFDAWIKYYEKDENHDNVSVSYYTKGSVVGFMLDAEIRQRSNGFRSLDDALRLAYSRHSGEAGYTPAQFQEACEEMAGDDLDAFFEAYVRGTEPLDLGPALATFGLREAAAETPDEEADEDPEAGWLGVRVGSGPRATVRQVVRDSPAWSADLLPDDEIVAVDGYRVEGKIDALLAHHPPGTEVVLTLSRRGRLIERPITLGTAPRPFELEKDPEASIEARDRRARWLAASTGPMPTPSLIEGSVVGGPGDDAAAARPAPATDDAELDDEDEGDEPDPTDEAPEPPSEPEP